MPNEDVLQRTKGEVKSVSSRGHRYIGPEMELVWTLENRRPVWLYERMQSERSRRGLRVLMRMDPDPREPCQPVEGLKLLL